MGRNTKSIWSRAAQWLGSLFRKQPQALPHIPVRSKTKPVSKKVTRLLGKRHAEQRHQRNRAPTVVKTSSDGLSASKPASMELMGKQLILQEITCPICIELIIDPACTPCGHCFCFKCLEEVLLFGEVCPTCRTNIKGIEVRTCKLLSHCIEQAHLSLATDKARQILHQRRLLLREWKADRTLDIDGLAVGLVIDVRDTEQIWCKARIEEILQEGTTKSILVHYLQWNKIYDEILELPTSRVAPENFFSSRTDIPRYKMREDEAIRAFVISGDRGEPEDSEPLSYTRLRAFLRPPDFSNYSEFLIRLNPSQEEGLRRNSDPHIDQLLPQLPVGDQQSESPAQSQAEEQEQEQEQQQNENRSRSDINSQEFSQNANLTNLERDFILESQSNHLSSSPSEDRQPLRFQDKHGQENREEESDDLSNIN